MQKVGKVGESESVLVGNVLEHVCRVHLDWFSILDDSKHFKI